MKSPYTEEEMEEVKKRERNKIKKFNEAYKKGETEPWIDYSKKAFQEVLEDSALPVEYGPKTKESVEMAEALSQPYSFAKNRSKEYKEKRNKKLEGN